VVTVFWAGGRGLSVDGPHEVAWIDDPGGPRYWMLLQPRTDRPGRQAAAAWQPLLDSPNIARSFFKALALVRSLSPRWKLPPFAQWQFVIGNELTSFARIEWALGVIVALQHAGGPLSRYHVLRQVGGDDPFYGDVGPASRVVSG